jgi:hypothetical protein
MLWVYNEVQVKGEYRRIAGMHKCRAPGRRNKILHGGS